MSSTEASTATTNTKDQATTSPNTNTSALPIHGSCSCKAVKYTLTTPPSSFSYICHCHDCRHSSGSSFAHNVPFHNTSLVIPEDSQANITTFGSEADGSKRFCKLCGSGVFLTVPKTEKMKDMWEIVLVCVGTIEGSDVDERFVPKAEGFVKRREKWMRKIDVEGAPEFEEW